MRSLFSFPNPVNDVSARLVAGGVAVLAVATLASHEWWLLVPLAYGFVARVLTGPNLSPLVLVVTKLVTPRLPLHPRYVPGPAKRFAQGIGAAFAVAAAVLALGLGLAAIAFALVAVLAVFATLEAALGLCVACRMFAFLIRMGLVPEHVCLECANVRTRAEA
jgi:hypothetical protein